MNANTITADSTKLATLEFQQVSFEGFGETSIRMQQFSGSIAEGELVEIELERHHDPRDLVSMMVGLNEPDEGQVFYKRQTWHGADYSRHFQMRSEIGRVFAGSAWVQSLTLRDNIQLAMRHHGTAKTEADERVEHWTERICGNQLAKVKWAMKKRPTAVEPSVLQLCQFIRAICNSPRLLILERPLRFMLQSHYESFIEAIDELRSTGTSVLFFAGDRDESELGFRKPVSYWRIHHGAIDSNGSARS